MKQTSFMKEQAAKIERIMSNLFEPSESKSHSSFFILHSSFLFALLSAVAQGAWAETIDLTVQNGDVLTGTFDAKKKIFIAAGASVTLQDVTINDEDNDEDNDSYKWAGITCLGDATIILEGTNTVRGFYYQYPAIYVPAGSTLTIKGSGSLDAQPSDITKTSTGAAGIGGGSDMDCGNIDILGGKVTAVGGAYCAGIGGAAYKSCGSITIIDATVTATGGNLAAGIGSGASGSCGTVNISYAIVKANGGSGAAAIGAGGYDTDYASCTDVRINYPIQLTATPGTSSYNDPSIDATKVYFDGTAVADADCKGTVQRGFGGEGTEARPYLITTPYQLSILAHNVDHGNTFSSTFFRMNEDLTLSGAEATGYTPIGCDYLGSKHFAGTFDGNGKAISGINFKDYNKDFVGVFGVVSGTVKHLTVAGSIFTAKDNVGGIAGYLTGQGTIESCVVTSDVVISASSAASSHGGIVGYNVGTVAGCVSAATLGSNTVTNVGGIVGTNYKDANDKAIVRDCFANNAYVHGAQFLGAIVGTNSSAAPGTLSGNYYTRCSVTYGDATEAKANNIGIGTGATTSADMTGAWRVYPYDVIPSGIGTAGTAYASGITPYSSGLLYDGKYYYIEVPDLGISLADNADNSDLIQTYEGATVNIELGTRVFYHDGYWETLCLPFDVDDFTGTPLSGATVKTLVKSNFEAGVLTLTFSDNLSAIEAGKPYIVKVPNDGVENIVFSNVTIKNVTANVSTDYIDFIGTYSPVSIYEVGDKTNLYLGGQNTLYYPTTTDFKVNSCRAYFKLKNGLTAGEGSNNVKAFNLIFDERPTLVSIPSGREEAGAWYTLDGRRLDSKPTQKGLYINKGKKVIIK